MIGAFGGVGSSVALGLAALARGRADATGLVTALPFFEGIGLDEPESFTVGGYDLRSDDFARAAGAVGGRRPAYSASLIDECEERLDAWTGNVWPGFRVNLDPATARLADWHERTPAQTPEEMAERFAADLDSFCTANSLADCVVVNVASTEPPATPHAAHEMVEALEAAVRGGDSAALPLSAWYAYAAIRSGRPYVNFTPSTGASLPSLVALAKRQRVPLAGRDGKTGETLLKTVLAPMLAARNLRVDSWVAHNLLGNRDGVVLADPRNRASKIKTKDQVLAALLGYAPHSLTTIEYVAPYDDWKTAWDHVQFTGFLGVPMSLQFTWQGCDSALAAPLVIDLARLALLAHRREESGPLAHLAAFFKDPMGTEEQNLFRQYELLKEYVIHVAQ